MKEIPLTQGKVALVDDEDFARLSQFRWHNQCGYAARNEKTERGRRTIFMHRLVVSVPKGMETDHINGNRADNRKCNLRICTHRQNIANYTALNSKNKSGYKGVYWDEEVRKWRACIRPDNIAKHLGYFSSPEEAARAYDNAAKNVFGEFAATNEASGRLSRRSP